MRVLPKRAPSRQAATTTAPQRTPRRTNRSEPRLENPSRKTRRIPSTTNEDKAFHTGTPATTTVKSLPHFLSRTTPGLTTSALCSGSKPETRLAANTDTLPRHETTTSRSTSRNETSVKRPEATIAAESRTNTLPAQHRPDQTFRNGVRNDYRNGVRNGPTGEYTLDRVQCVFVPVKPVVTTLRQSRFT